MRLRPPLLYGPNNKPLAYGLYPSVQERPHLRRPRVSLRRDTRRNVTASDRRELVEISRQLVSQVANLGAAIVDKNQWAFGDGWTPHYTGSNEAWGAEATAFLAEQFFPNADRHGRYDFLTLLFLSGVAWDRDGDDLMLLTQSPSGFPKLEFIPSVRIGNSSDVINDTVSSGPYDGYRIFDGIIFDDFGTPVAARVLGADQEWIDTYQDYSLGFGGTADLAYLPEWCDQGRGIPLVGRPMFDWMDIQETDEFLKRGIKRASSIGLMQTTVGGEAGLGNEIITQEETTDTEGAARTLHYDEVEGGETYYLTAGAGEKLETLNFQTPHPNVEKFIERIERRGLKAVGWSYELIYLAESGRAATRLVCQLGNNSVWRQQKLGLRRTWRAVRYALAKAMKNGFISRNGNPRDAYFAWDFGLPKELSVDLGNDEQAARENLKMGLTSKTIELAKRGYHRLEVQRHRKAEILQNAADASDIETQTGGKIPFDKALELLEQRAANPTAQAAQAQAPQAKPAESPAEDDET